MLPLRISIVTPSYNQAGFIERTIRSILDQQGDAFELDYLVVDGGSKDGTLEILRSVSDPRMRWASERDNGQTHAINKGLRAVSGDVVGWVNSDDLLLPGALQRVAQAFAQHPHREWLHGRCEIIDESDRPVRRWVSLYKDYRARRHTFENLLTENYVSQMTAFWRRAVHDQIGLLDESLNFAFDYDLWLRLARRGDPIYIDEQLACFRWYPTSKSGAQFESQFREDAAVAFRYAGPRPALRLRKALKSVGIVAAYRMLSVVRRAR